MSILRGDMGVAEKDGIHTIQLQRACTTRHCDGIHTKDHTNGHPTETPHPSPIHFPLQPIYGLKVLDRPRPARGGLVVVEMLLEAVNREEGVSTNDDDEQGKRQTCRCGV